VRATVVIPPSAGPAATGVVTLRYDAAGHRLLARRITNGYFSVVLRLRRGTYWLYGDYSGDRSYLPHRSNVVVLRVV
jgi:hypothetical protein